VISLRWSLPSLMFVLTLSAAPASAQANPVSAQLPPLKLYVLDCGSYPIVDMGRFSLTQEEVSTTELSIACFLVVHPKGTLVWDTGCVPDSAWKPTGAATKQHVTLPDGQQRDVTMRKQLLPQLLEAGYSPEEVTYLGLSHYHFDHTANANAFAEATWLVRRVERDAMFADKPPNVTQPSTYAGLRDNKAFLIETNDHDVFGDGSVVIKLAAGHTPGHQVLYLRLPNTGAVVLSGDLYHFPEARTLHRVPTFDFDRAQSQRSRDAIERFLSETGAQLWIQHDFRGNAQLKKAPAFYD
jgi:N-acyl homoserine lactone hydrolase